MGNLNFTPQTWVSAMIDATDFNTDIRDAFKEIQDPWDAYTPTWTAATTNPTIGNGTISGAYNRLGKTVIGRVSIVPGSTTTVGSGIYSIGLPFSTTGTDKVIGPCLWIDSGVNYRIGSMYINGPATNEFMCHVDAGTATWGSTGNPIVIATPDRFRGIFMYEAA